MEFRLLGPLEVRDGDRAVALGGVKQRALLALLLLNVNRVVPRERLIDELWGEHPPETAVASVQVYVSRLRKLLPAGALETRPPGYLLAVEPESVDLQRFRRLTAQARSADPGEASRLLEQALGLWRGTALAEFVEEPFARVEAGRLEELRLVALEDRFEAELALGRHRELVAELEPLIAVEPQRERLRAQLMLALYRCGRHGEALAAFQEARAVLDELGLEPSSALRQLERQILTQDPGLDPEPQRLADEREEATRDATPETPARRKTVTVVFCDLANATVIGEARDPEATQALMARSFERTAAIVAAHGGTAKRLTGDAVVAVFGVPAVHEDDVLRALRSVLELRGALVELGVEARFGVNTGEVVTSSDEALVTGHAVNLAARLQAAARVGEILVGVETLQSAEGAAVIEEFESSEPVAAFRLLALGERPERSHRSLFVGRSKELELLRAAWSRVVEGGSCELVTIVGEPGVGKSRLVAEFLGGLDARVVSGRCPSYGEGNTYFPVVEVLGQLADVEAPAESAAPLAALLRESDAPTSTEEIAWGFRQLLEAAAPLVVVFDDIQWGEDTFLDLVEQVALLSVGGPLLVACLARPELAERRPQWPLALRLEPLPHDDVETLLPTTIAAELRGRIAHAAGGNPLFLTEMVAVATDSADDEVVVPATLKALLAMRIDQLEEAERGVLERGAVEGEIFHRGAVQALAPGTPIASRLAALVRRELIRPERPLLPREDRFRFCHLLIRDAAYDAIPKATRAELHERFADWLDHHAAGLVEHDELVGYHLEQAYRYRAELGEPDPSLGARAAARLGAAGFKAGDRGDRRAATKLLQRALTLDIIDERERLGLEIELVYHHANLLQWEEGRALLAETLAAAERLGDRGLIARVRVQTLMPFFASGFGSEPWRRELDDVSTILTEFGDHFSLAVAAVLRASVYRRTGRVAAACAEYERALTHFGASGHPGRSAVREYVHSLCAGPASVQNATDRCEELRRWASGGRPIAGAVIERGLSLLAAMEARADEARELGRRSGEILDRVGDHDAFQSRIRDAAEAERLLGDAAAAEQHLLAGRRRYAAIATSAGRHLVELATSSLAMLYCDEGRWGEAERLLSEPSPTEVWAELMLRPAAAARVAAHQGRLEEALALARGALELGDESDLLNLRARVWLALAEVERAAGNAAGADAAVAKALGLYEQKGNVAAAARLRDEHAVASPT
jgi:DNA-binding SARP family transcriptional activator